MFASALCTVEVSVWDGEEKEEGSKDLSVVFFQLALTGETAFEIIGSYLENAEFYFQNFIIIFKLECQRKQGRLVSLSLMSTN